MLDLFGNNIVGFPTRRLTYFSRYAIDTRKDKDVEKDKDVVLQYITQDYLLQGTRRFGELGGKQWKAPQTRGSIYPILFSFYVHFRNLIYHTYKDEKTKSLYAPSV